MAWDDGSQAFGEQGDEVDAAIGVQGDGTDGLQGDGGHATEHVEDAAAAFDEQGEQGDAATEGVQLPEADGLQGASTNAGGASGIIFRTTNSTCTLYPGFGVL
ncbi:uncharacterized protein [Miscanthus floridulus]|uniref:uncharacterized protein isoform X2 n=1 Tax=Miscanthus floridulus TaxID=154761 RepID=UPI0034584621